MVISSGMITALLIGNEIIVVSPIAVGAGTSASIGTIAVEAAAKSFLRESLKPLLIKWSAAGGISGVFGSAAAGTIAFLSSPYVLVAGGVVSAVLVGKAVYEAVQKSDNDFQYSVAVAASASGSPPPPPPPPPPGGFEAEFIEILLKLIVKYKWKLVKALIKAAQASEDGKDGSTVFLEELSFFVAGKELAYIFKKLELFTETKYFGDCSSYLSKLIVGGIKNTYHGKSSKEFSMTAIDKLCQKILFEELDVILEEHYRISLNDKAEAKELLRELLGEIYVIKGLDKEFKRLKENKHKAKSNKSHLKLKFS